MNVSELPAPAPIVAPVVPKPPWPAVPVTLPHVAVPAAAQVTVPPSVTPAGSVSLTVTDDAADGPPLVTTTT